MPTATILALLIAAAPASADSGAAAKPQSKKIELRLSDSPLPKGASKLELLRTSGDRAYEKAPEPSPLVAEKDADGRLKLYHGPNVQNETKQPKAGKRHE